MKVGQFGKLLITENGDVYNIESDRPISLFYDAKNNPVFRSPDLLTNFKLDYVMAMLFLNNGEFIEKITDYYVRHKDGDFKNCKLSNLELITDKEEVNDIRFGHLKTGSRANYSRAVYPLYVANKSTCAIDVYSVKDFCKKFGISESNAVKKAKNCDRIYRNNFDLYVCETMLEAWECL